jgi:hypothetical protein
MPKFIIEREISGVVQAATSDLQGAAANVIQAKRWLSGRGCRAADADRPQRLGKT